MAAYAVSKAALVHLTRVLDLELRPLGIPGERRRAAAARHPQEPSVLHARPAGACGRAGAAADIIVYLVSDAAAPVSGAVVPAYGA